MYCPIEDFKMCNVKVMNRLFLNLYIFRREIIENFVLIRIKFKFKLVCFKERKNRWRLKQKTQKINKKGKIVFLIGIKIKLR